MKTEFKIDLKEYDSTRERHEIVFDWIFMLLAIIIFTTYYWVFGTESTFTTLYFVISFLIISFLIFTAIKKAVRDSKKQWNSYTIKLTEQGLRCEYLAPIHLDGFQKTSWTEKQTEIKWKNLEFTLESGFLIFDKSVPSLNRKLFSQGIIKIPNELENKNELIESIKTFANNAYKK